MRVLLPDLDKPPAEPAPGCEFIFAVCHKIILRHAGLLHDPLDLEQPQGRPFAGGEALPG